MRIYPQSMRSIGRARPRPVSKPLSVPPSRIGTIAFVIHINEPPPTVPPWGRIIGPTFPDKRVSIVVVIRNITAAVWNDPDIVHYVLKVIEMADLSKIAYTLRSESCN